MNLEELPIGEVVSGVDLPNRKTFNKTAKWAHYLKKMKVGDAVRVSNAKERDAMTHFFKANKAGTATSQVGDGSFVVWRTRFRKK
jgi:hypothetical protein